MLSDDPAYSPRGSVQTSITAEGEIIVVWLARAAKDNSLVMMARKISQKGVLSGPVVLSTFAAKQNAEFPQMMIIGQDLIFAWTQADVALVVNKIKIPKW